MVVKSHVSYPKRSGLIQNTNHLRPIYFTHGHYKKMAICKYFPWTYRWGCHTLMACYLLLDMVAHMVTVHAMSPIILPTEEHSLVANPFIASYDQMKPTNHPKECLHIDWLVGWLVAMDMITFFKRWMVCL